MRRDLCVWSCGLQDEAILPLPDVVFQTPEQAAQAQIISTTCPQAKLHGDRCCHTRFNGINSPFGEERIDGCIKAQSIGLYINIKDCLAVCAVQVRVVR